MTEPEFRALLDRYLNGNASPEERKLLDQFFDSYQHHHQEISGIRADVKSDIKEAIVKQLREKKEGAIKIVPMRRTSLWLQVAAAISLVLLASYFLFTSYSSQNQTTNTLAIKTLQHSTTRGQRYDIVMPDGSLVKLNSNSSISYPEKFEGATREITLDGEAYFEVSHDATKPFIVHTGNTSTRVLGTSFNVNADADATTVTLVEGKVNVITPAGDTTLMPNQQAIIKSGSETIKTASVDVTPFTAWTNNRLIFDNMPLSEVFQKLENWYNVDIDVDSEAINNCVITGKYENESLENVLNSLSFMMKMEYTINNRHVAVKGKGCN
jgi:transmembrane sensor